METIVTIASVIIIICAIIKKLWSYDGIRKTILALCGVAVLIGIPTLLIYWLGFLAGMLVAVAFFAYGYLTNN